MFDSFFFCKVPFSSGIQGRNRQIQNFYMKNFSDFPSKILDIIFLRCDNKTVERVQTSHNFIKGLVAQLGAHHIRIVGVVGSNPIRSTKKRTTAVILPWFFFIFLHQKYPLAYSSKQAFQIACLGDIKFLKILFDNIFHNSTKCDTINCNINWMIFPVSGIEKVMIV